MYERIIPVDLAGSSEATEKLKDELIEVWEAAVRSSHHFLSEEDIRFFKPLVREHYLSSVELNVIRNVRNRIAAFMGLSFRVAPGVLIPRQDTEILCEEALSRMKPGARVLDIGTGSGALAVSLAKLGDNAQVTAVDVSDIALSIARDNARRLGAQVRFLHSDCFAAVAGETFDLIVSNPPYISRGEMETLMPEVRREPELALAGGEDGLDYYRRIAREAPAHLNKGGCLLFEIGWQQRDAVSALVRESVGEPFSLKDYGGNWRVVGALRR